MKTKTLLHCLLFASISAVACNVHAAPGELDQTFGNAGKVRAGFGGGVDHIEAVTFQADGKVIGAGYAVDGGKTKFLVARYSVDGSLDVAFGNAGVALAVFPSGYVGAKAVAVQADGKILAAGATYTSSPSSDFGIIRFNTDGSLDTSFGNGGMVTTDFSGDFDEARGIGVLTDGRILVVGLATVSGSSDFALAQYNPDGSIDGTFGIGGKVTTPSTGQPYSFAFQTGNKIIVAGDRTSGGLTLARYNPNGSLDTTFDNDGIVSVGNVNGSNAALGIQTTVGGTSKIVVAAYNGVVRFILNDGSLDTTFGTSGIVTTPPGNSGIIIQSNAGNATRILVSGSSANPSGGSIDFTLSRYFLSGLVDTAFGTGGIIYTPVGLNVDTSLAMRLRSNRIVVAGYASDGASSFPKEDSALVAYNLADGSPDTSFNGNGKRVDDFGNSSARAAGIVLQADGKIVAAGSNDSQSNQSDFGVARFNADGSPDTSFGILGKVTTNIGGFDQGAAVALQTDGKIVVAGSAGGQVAVARYNSNGSLDANFGNGGSVVTAVGMSSFATAVKIQSDGKIVVGGATASSNTTVSQDFVVLRYGTNGALDGTFGSQGRVITPVSSASDVANSLQIEADGKIILAGTAAFQPTSRFAVARYNTDGILDQTFGSFGVAATDFPNLSAAAEAAAIQFDGKIIVAGAVNDNVSTFQYALARYFPNGTLDPAFDGDGRVTTQIGVSGDGALAAVVQPDGKIIATGISAVGVPSTVISAVRYNADGSLDTTYGVGGKVAVDVTDGFDEGLSIALDSSGRAVIGGEADGLMGIIRLQGMAGPIPTPTPAATPTPTPPASPTPTPGVTPTPGPSTTPGATPIASPSGTPTATPISTPGLIGNVATRLPVGVGDDVLIEGFIVQGPPGSSKKIIVRALGPFLTQFGIPDALANPTLEIHDASNVTVAINDNWRSTQLGGLITGDQAAEIAASGIGPGNDLESAIIADLVPGSYTAVVRGAGNSVGTGVVDAFDLSPASPARLANIATRGLVQPGDKLMIAGFTIQNGPVRAVVATAGPSLAAFGITNPLPDTTLQLRNQDGAIVRENDDWRTDQQQELVNTGLQPSNDLEAALIETLPPGQYTAQVRGKPEGTGKATVQIYFLQ